jgi:hypothetical protein
MRHARIRNFVACSAIVRRVVLAFGVLVVAACDGPRAKPVDAGAADAAIDVAIDMMIDAPPDAPVDVALDAPSSSPACTTTAATILDVSPSKQILSMARSGDTLYVSATDIGAETGRVVYSIDLATGAQTGAPTTYTGTLQLWPSAGDVFGAEFLDNGTIWQFHPGSAPVAIIQNRPYPAAITVEGGYVYWAEGTSASPQRDHVMRRLIAGGPVEPIMDCPGTTRLVIDGTNIYCSYNSGVLRKLKNGTGVPEGISYPSQGSLIFTMVKDGAALYFGAFGTGILYKIDTFGSAAVAVATIQNSARISGIAINAEYYYVADHTTGIRRTHRANLVQEVVTVGSNIGDPILWNNQLIYTTDNPQLSGQHYVKRCVN